jgi:dTDP-4-dehydrorhamnose 3,5-epimerase
MNFIATSLDGAYVLEPELLVDERGFFARSFCRNEFMAKGLVPDLAQCNISYNNLRGTLRGMHYQVHPCPEAKLVRCTHGAIFDVIIDLIPGSSTYLQWFGVELSAQNRKSLYVPPGFAHGFLTLDDHAEVIYQMSEFYRADLAAGVRWNDPMFSIVWPADVAVISERDASYPDFCP